MVKNTSALVKLKHFPGRHLQCYIILIYKPPCATYVHRKCFNSFKCRYGGACAVMIRLLIACLDNTIFRQKYESVNVFVYGVLCHPGAEANLAHLSSLRSFIFAFKSFLLFFHFAYKNKLLTNQCRLTTCNGSCKALLLIHAHLTPLGSVNSKCFNLPVSTGVQWHWC